MVKYFVLFFVFISFYNYCFAEELVLSDVIKSARNQMIRESLSQVKNAPEPNITDNDTLNTPQELYTQPNTDKSNTNNQDSNIK